MQTADSESVLRRLDFAASIAREAGQHALQYFQRDDLAVDRKDDSSPVTVADREAEQLLRGRIEHEFPEDAILGEEFGEQSGSSGYRWILDPIDGTKSFISGVPLFGTLVGVEFEGDAIIGAIEIPALNERVYAAVGHGASYVCREAPPKSARVADQVKLSDGLLLTSEFAGWESRGALAALTELQSQAWFTRTWGDCYGYLLVATGRAVAMVDPVMSVWDAAALLPVLQEAGGKFTDWQGRPTIHGGEGIGAAPGVLDQVLAVTRKWC